MTIVFPLIPMPALATGKQALLIGIQDYSNTPFKSLKGPANDLKLTQGMLRERFGFQNEDFIILKDAEATHTGIENAFKQLINQVKKAEKAQEGDFVYIYYSGHGSQTPDLNGDEADDDNKDETWVSYGSRSSLEEHQDNYDVLDDEIEAWLADLYAKTDRVVFVSDSCHSATVSRAAEQSEEFIRAVEVDKRPHLLGKKYPKSARSQSIGKSTIRRGIRVSAAGDHENAIERAKKNQQYYGLFTWYWVSHLEQAKADYTWHDVFKQTYVQVTGERGIAQQPDMQQPQMEGRLRWLLGKNFDFVEQPQTMPISSIIHEEKVKMLVGSLAGVTEGSIYRLYDPNAFQLDNLPRLTITQVTPFASYGESEPKFDPNNELEPKNAFKKGDLIVEESHAYDFEKFKVYLDVDYPEDQPLLKVIQSAFQSTSDEETFSFFPYRLTQDSSHADLRLHLLRPKLENGRFVYEKENDALPKSFSNQPPELWVLTSDGQLFNEKLRISFEKPTQGVKLLKDNLKKLARLREFKALKSSHLAPVKVQIDIWHQSQSAQEGQDCHVNENVGRYCKTKSYHLSELDKQTPSLGDVLTFTLDNPSKENYYCYLLNLSPDGVIEVIYPNLYERNESVRLKAGKTQPTTISLYLQKKGERTIKLITSRQQIDASLFEQSAYRLRADSNPLERLLVNALHGQRGTQSIRNDEWATEQTTFEVK
jgi:hypothetical protein